MKFLGKNPADYYRKYEGVLTTYTKKNKLTVEFPIEVWDVRDPLKPVLLGVYTTVSASESTVINETYSGSEKTKPATLRQTTTPLKSENELKAEIKVPSVKNIVKNNLETFVDILNEKISFK